MTPPAMPISAWKTSEAVATTALRMTVSNSLMGVSSPGASRRTVAVYAFAAPPTLGWRRAAAGKGQEGGNVRTGYAQRAHWTGDRVSRVRRGVHGRDRLDHGRGRHAEREVHRHPSNEHGERIQAQQ